jgi:putative MATE family efflux protein
MHSKRREELGTQPLGKLLIKYAAPATIGMMVNALYNLVDAIFIGQGAGALAIGGLAIAFPIQLIFLAIATTVGVGSASIISRALGAGDEAKADRVVGNAILTITVVSVLVSSTGLFLLEPMVRLFGATDAILPYAMDYLSIILFGLFFYAFMVCCSNTVRAEGNARASMYGMVIGAGLNVILDPIFIFGFGMGVRGAALATVIALGISTAYFIWFYWSGRSHLNIALRSFAPDLPMLREIAAIGSSSFMRMIGGSLLAVVLNNMVATHGSDIHLAVVGASNRLMAFLGLPLIGMVQGLQPILGFNYGMGKMDRVRDALKLGTRVATWYSLGMFVLVMFLAEPMIAMFSTEAALVSEGGTILRILNIMVPLVGFQIVGATLFQALGKAKPAFFLNSARQVLFLIPLLLLLPPVFRLTGVWAAFPIADALASAVTAVMVAREIASLNAKHAASLVVAEDPAVAEVEATENWVGLE